VNRPTPAEQAAEWLVRCDRGLSPAEQDEYLQWLAADPRHGDALAREQATWRELDRLADWRPEHAPEPNPALLAPPRRAAHRPLLRFAPLAFAAAACVAMALFLPRDAPAPAPPVSVPPAVAAGYEERRLDDGSVVGLNRGTAITVVFAAGERRVRLLGGEAHFTVVSDAARPFIVEAAGVETRAVGTAFNVRLADAGVDVLVTEGIVQVTAAGPSAPVARLVRGERVTVSPVRSAAAAPRLMPVGVTADEIDRTLAWRPRLLEFSSAPLAEVVAEFNRHNPVQLALADPALAALPVFASFRSDNVEGFVRLLEATAGVRAERRGGTISLRRANSP
jgi:transmembrane sensor